MVNPSHNIFLDDTDSFLSCSFSERSAVENITNIM